MARRVEGWKGGRVEGWKDGMSTAQNRGECSFHGRQEGIDGTCTLWVASQAKNTVKYEVSEI